MCTAILQICQIGQKIWPEPDLARFAKKWQARGRAEIRYIPNCYCLLRMIIAWHPDCCKELNRHWWFDWYLQVVEKVQRIIEPLSSEQQQSIEILVDNISLASAAVSSLVKGPGTCTPFICMALLLLLLNCFWLQFNWPIFFQIFFRSTGVPKNEFLVELLEHYVLLFHFLSVNREHQNSEVKELKPNILVFSCVGITKTWVIYLANYK